MKNVTITCNMCGRELPKNGYTSMTIEATHRPYSCDSYENEYLNIDLCPDCMKRMLHLLGEKTDYFEKKR